MEPQPKYLLRSFKLNCKNVENNALNTVASYDIPVFNNLRDLKAKDCLNALNKFSSVYGIDISVERCICLIAITDYICCSFKSCSFYIEFFPRSSERLLNLLFHKLSIQWRNIFSEKNKDFLTTRLQYILPLLRVSISKLPADFPHMNTMFKILLKGDTLHQYLRCVSLNNNGENNDKPKTVNLSKRKLSDTLSKSGPNKIKKKKLDTTQTGNTDADVESNNNVEIKTAVNVNGIVEPNLKIDNNNESKLESVITENSIDVKTEKCSADPGNVSFCSTTVKRDKLSPVGRKKISNNITCYVVPLSVSKSANKSDKKQENEVSITESGCQEKQVTTEANCQLPPVLVSTENITRPNAFDILMRKSKKNKIQPIVVS